MEMSDTVKAGCFVTGTDTGVGKTWVSAGLMAALRQRGLRIAGMKPVASGCKRTSMGLRNEDALLLREQASREFAYELVNPIAFEPPIAPHIAARKAGIEIRIDRIVDTFTQLSGHEDYCVVEGVGGWLVPLNDRQSVADLAISLGLPVVLVVGIRLGCLNHALLTAQAIKAQGAALTGWVANFIDPCSNGADETVAALQERLPAPCLGVIPHLARLDVNAVAEMLDVAPLLAPHKPVRG